MWKLSVNDNVAKSFNILITMSYIILMDQTKLFSDLYFSKIVLFVYVCKTICKTILSWLLIKQTESLQ